LGTSYPVHTPSALLTDDVNFDHLDEVVLARVLHCKLHSPPSPWEQVTKCSLHSRGGELNYLLGLGDTSM
jgi:hypothetical protein